MPAFGGMSPFPLRLGGGRPRSQVVLDGLNADRGDAYNATDSTTTVYAENLAIARAISAAWGTNYRLGTIWDARRMPVEIVGRWEAILKLSPAATDTEAERREVVADKLAAVGTGTTPSAIYTALSSALGTAFVSVEYLNYASSVISVPDGTYPWGTVGSSPWSTNLARVLVRLQTPTGGTEADFQEAAGKVSSVLDPMLPAWTGYDWYRCGPVSTAGGGLSAAGFYLDDDHNLDNEIFDV